MMRVSDYRRENAQKLAYNLISFAEFAARIGKSASYVSRIIGKNPDLEIGHATARKIETIFKVPLGWLDEPNFGTVFPLHSQRLVSSEEINNSISIAGIEALIPSANKGDFAIFIPYAKVLLSNHSIVLLEDNNEIKLMEVQHMPDRFHTMLLPLGNTDAPMIELTDDSKIKGVFVGCSRLLNLDKNRLNINEHREIQHHEED